MRNSKSVFGEAVQVARAVHTALGSLLLFPTPSVWLSWGPTLSWTVLRWKVPSTLRLREAAHVSFPIARHCFWELGEVASTAKDGLKVI